MVGIDLRKEFEIVLQETGHYILLQRTKKGLRCRCWSERYLEPIENCPICNGTGRVVRIERHLSRRDSASQIVSSPNLTQQAPIGRMSLDAQRFFFKHDAHPQVGDYIFEVGWNKETPTHLQKIYAINEVQPMRGDRGRIEYWRVSVREESKNKDLKEITVRSFGPVKNYEFLR